MNALEEAIKKTNEYAAKYGQILSDNQLFLRLIAPKRYSLSELKGKGKKVTKNQEYLKKIALAKKLVTEHLSKMKGILMVGISGSVAAENAKKNEDIDLLVITKADEMWWWRLYVRFYLWKNKIPHRHFHQKEKANEFCFNLWMDSNNLEIPKGKRNLKNASDLVMMKVIYDKDNIYQKFLRKNTWVEKYLATGYNSRLEKFQDTSETKSGVIKKLINDFLFGGQYLYMLAHNQKRLKDINLGQAFFHEEK